MNKLRVLLCFVSYVVRHERIQIAGIAKALFKVSAVVRNYLDV